jgi:hypothetical protein
MRQSVYPEGQLTMNAGLEELNGKMKMKTSRLKGLNRNILLRLVQADDLPSLCDLYQSIGVPGRSSSEKECSCPLRIQCLTILRKPVSAPPVMLSVNRWVLFISLV